MAVSMEQRFANFIQSLEQSVKAAQAMYDNGEIQVWAINHSLALQEQLRNAKQYMKDTFSIEYDTMEASEKVIKEGSKVEVLVNHMPDMKGSKAIIKRYSMPAMLSDITMEDGMKMKDHKWLTNDEVKLIS